MHDTALRTIIVDDERLARSELRRLLSTLADVTVVGEAASVPEAVAIVQAVRPDLALIDVELEGGTGFDLLARHQHGMQAIIVSAHDNHAVRAFDHDAVDYLLKPVQAGRLDAAVRKAKSQIASRSSQPSGETRRIDSDERLFLASGQDIGFVAISHIRAVIAEGDYTRLLMADGRDHLVLKTMKEWEERLPGNVFARIHRSTLINLRCVQRVDAWFNRRYRVHVEGIAKPLMMSRNYASSLKARWA